MPFEADKDSEDTAAVIFDANGDTHPDIYVASGGYHTYNKEDKAMQDRLYLNNGEGSFSKSENALPPLPGSKGCVAVNDINGDGYPDIFVGGRVVPGRYPETPESYVLINDGKGTFTDRTGEIAPELQQAGMITDAVWADLNADGSKELIVVGEWMPVTVFSIKDNTLQNDTSLYFDTTYSGWWNTVTTADVNSDGKPDLIIGNTGTNTQFKVSKQEPAALYFKDFDQNGAVDPLFCYYIQGKSYPYVTRDEFLGQLNSFRSRFTRYEDYAKTTLTDIFTGEVLKNTRKYTATHMETTLFCSTVQGTFEKCPLPVQAQYAPRTRHCGLRF